MENLTLTWYISKYREVSLKFDGLDDFQHVRGFIQGLNNKYKAKIKTQYPKTLEEAIKSAQIFDDTLEKSHIAKFPSARTNVSTPTSKFNNNANKRKEVGGGTNDTKKQKVRKGKLTSEEMARAWCERLCFGCLGKHEQKDCPLKSVNESDKGGGAKKAMHCVQILALTECPKYLAVEVNHNLCEHDCQS